MELVGTGAGLGPPLGALCPSDIEAIAAEGGAASIPALAVESFPNASVFEAYLQPNTGHGINVHYNSTASHKVVSNFLAAHGLGAN